MPKLRQERFGPAHHVRIDTFGFVLLFIWLGVALFLSETVYNLHGPMFGLTHHELQLIFYCGMGLLKICVLTFFFIPWLSIKLVLRNSRMS